MNKTETIVAARIRGATVIKLIVLGSTLGYTIIGLLCGIASLFGVEILQWNDEYVTGVTGFVASPFIGAFIGLIFGLFSAAFTYLGLRTYAFFRAVSVEYIAYSSQT
ncbi:MAG TPA: hypothetical protein VFK45_08730 [Gammaproteobacteria bacterium]|nr:hypothetical protein [Gammaproteobacteria bacterium]